MKRLSTMFCALTLCATMAWADGIELTLEFLNGTESYKENVKTLLFSWDTTPTVKVKLADGTESTEEGVRTICFGAAATTSLAECQLERGNVKVFPNPTAERIIIEGSEGSIKLCDLNGSVLRDMNSNNKTLEVTVNDLPAGVYLLMVNKETIKITKK